MKKLLAIICVFVLILGGLTSCATSDVKDTDTESATENSSETSLDGGDEASKQALRAKFLEKADAVSVSDTSVTFTDGSDSDSVTVAKNPQKTLNLYSSFTTLWYEAGGTVAGCIGGSSAIEVYKEYIGRDITLDEGVSVVATSAAGKNWDVEGIVNMQPDLIICSTAMSGYSTIKSAAKSAGIQVIVMEYDDFSDYLKWFKVCCNLTGHGELWESVALKALDEVVSDLTECRKQNSNPSVFCMFSSSKTLTANTSNTVVGAMLEEMKAVNIVDSWYNEGAEERITVNLETVYAANPDIIIIQCHGGVDTVKQLVEEQYGDNAIWNALTAVKEGRVYYLDKALFHNKPNSRFADAYGVLAEILYPELAA